VNAAHSSRPPCTEITLMREHACIEDTGSHFAAKLLPAFIALQPPTILRYTQPWTTVMGRGYIGFGL
jgi:hypothetical protein